MPLKQLGGAAVGMNAFFNTHASWPFASLEIGFDKITIHMLFWKYVFFKHQVTSVAINKILFVTEIKINHTKKKNPYVVFRTSKPTQIIKALNDLGYKVEI